MTFTDVTRHDGMKAEDYFAIDAVSNSDLGLLNEGPRVYRDKVREETDAMRFGSAFDSFMLTPELYAKEYATVPEGTACPTTEMQAAFVNLLAEGVSEKEAGRLAGYKTAQKASKFSALLTFRDEHNGQHILSYEEATNIDRMAQLLNTHTLAKKILAESDKQVVFTGIHEDTGLFCKCMVDMMWTEEDWTWVVDLKTTSAGDAPAFRRNNFFKYGYDRQAAFYKALSGADDAALMIVSKVSDWHMVADLLEYTDEGEHKAEQLLRKMKWHKEHDEWDRSMEYVTQAGWETL